LKLIGFKHNQAKPAILEHFFKEAENIGLPKHWEQVDKIKSGNNFLSIHQVNQGSQEWQSIESNFKKTMGNSTVVQIERI
jgi:hypothetical protein